MTVDRSVFAYLTTGWEFALGLVALTLLTLIVWTPRRK